MEAKKLNELLDSFNVQADSVKNKLTNLLVIVSDGRVPGKEELQSFNVDMDTLVSEYDQLKEEVESILTADELPKDGSRAAEYVEAVANSNSRIIKLKLEKAESVLQRFLKVKSRIVEYETALSPFKEKAAGVLKELSEDNIEKLFPETEAPEIFLKALDTENINDPEGFKILEEINRYYPMQIQWGLVGRQYFVDESQEIKLQNNESAERPIENTDEVAVADDKQQEAEIVSEKVTKEATTEEHQAEIAEELTEEMSGKFAKNQTSATVDEQMEDELEAQKDILTAINRVKSGTPNASSFKKEIIKIVKNNKEARDVLSLMTNLGVLTQEQIYMFGICMDCFEESDRDREKVEAAVETLVNKGYLACFEYDRGDSKKGAYCLSTYCYGCLKKNSISVQMRGFWSLSFGDTKVITSSVIAKDVIEKFVRNNDRLAEYLYAVKGLVDPDKYQAIKQSIKWKEDYYRIAVVKGGETTNCYLYDPDNLPDDINEDGILVIGEDTKIDAALMDVDKKIFVYENQSVTLLGEESGGTEKTADEDLINESEKSAVQEPAENEDPESKTAPIEVKTEKIVMNEEASAEKDDDSEEVSVKSLLKKKTVPKDEEFCMVIEQLLNREAATKEQLTSIISQTIAFAKAVGDVATKENGEQKDHMESYKLSAQLRLASNLMLNECTYTSEFLSSVFPNPDNDDPAIMLSAYMFAMLIPGMAFDYGMKNQMEIFLDRYEDYFDDFAAFKPLFNKLMGVKDAAATGFSPAFVSLLGDEAESEKFINELRSSARECLTVKAPKTRMKALPPMYSACFG